jgi:hypothetical protein
MQEALPDHRLTGVDPGRFDCDEDLTGRRNGTRDVTYLEDVDPAVLIELHCLAHESYDRQGRREIPEWPQPKRPEM